MTGLLLLPFAPVRGTLWVADHLLQEARRQARDPRLVQARLAALNQALDAGTIDEETFEKEEERLLALLDSPVRRLDRAPAAKSPSPPRGRRP
jgi:hypothetical protein